LYRQQLTTDGTTTTTTTTFNDVDADLVVDDVDVDVDVEVDWKSTDLNDLYRQVRKEAMPKNLSEDYSWKAVQRRASDDCLSDSLRVVYLEEVNDDVLLDLM
jgi:hypothetical protein